VIFSLGVIFFAESKILFLSDPISLLYITLWLVALSIIWSYKSVEYCYSVPELILYKLEQERKDYRIPYNTKSTVPYVADLAVF
jgi:hypothetical protein